MSDTAEYDIWLPESEMQIGEFVQQLVLEVLSVLPVKQELQVRQVQSVLRVLDLYLCSYDSLPPLFVCCSFKIFALNLVHSKYIKAENKGEMMMPMSIKTMGHR